MKQETKQLIGYFEQITKNKPKSASLGTGSMRGTICFKMIINEDIKKFANHDNLYKQKNKNFNGIEIKFIDNFWDDNFDYVTFHVDISEIINKSKSLNS